LVIDADWTFSRFPHECVVNLEDFLLFFLGMRCTSNSLFSLDVGDRC
jgi:hypothetical protein